MPAGRGSRPAWSPYELALADFARHLSLWLRPARRLGISR
jgi:hypothetical protein